MNLIIATSLSTADAGGWGWRMAISGWLMMSLLVVVVAWLVWSTVRPPGPPHPRVNRALALLSERYGRGDVDREEYLERMADLER